MLDLSLEEFPLELAMDTGFDGSVLIPFPLFRSLGLLSAISGDQASLVLPDSRRLPLYTSVCRATLGGSRFETAVHSSPEVDKKVVGREFLRMYVATLEGRAEELTLAR